MVQFLFRIYLIILHPQLAISSLLSSAIFLYFSFITYFNFLIITFHIYFNHLHSTFGQIAHFPIGFFGFWLIELDPIEQFFIPFDLSRIFDYKPKSCLASVWLGLKNLNTPNCLFYFPLLFLSSFSFNFCFSISFLSSLFLHFYFIIS